MRSSVLVLSFLLSVAIPAAAEDASPLTSADLRYLKTLGQSQADLIAMKPTAAMLEKLHELINDPGPKPKAKSDAVYRWLDHIQAQYVWCSDHPKDQDCGEATETAAQ